MENREKSNNELDYRLHYSVFMLTFLSFFSTLIKIEINPSSRTQTSVSKRYEEETMHSRGQYHIGILLIAIGALFLFARILDVSVWRIIFPGILIGLGVWLLIRQRHVDPDAKVNQKFLGDIRREGTWEVTTEEFRIFIGDVELDMTQANIPDGETAIRIFGFIGDVNVTIPKGVGITTSSTGFIVDAKVLNQKQEKFFTSVQLASDNYTTTKRKILLETTYFINDLNVRQD